MINLLPLRFGEYDRGRCVALRSWRTSEPVHRQRYSFPISRNRKSVAIVTLGVSLFKPPFPPSPLQVFLGSVPAFVAGQPAIQPNKRHATLTFNLENCPLPLIYFHYCQLFSWRSSLQKRAIWCHITFWTEPPRRGAEGGRATEGDIGTGIGGVGANLYIPFVLYSLFFFISAFSVEAFFFRPLLFVDIFWGCRRVVLYFSFVFFLFVRVVVE